MQVVHVQNLPRMRPRRPGTCEPPTSVHSTDQKTSFAPSSSNCTRTSSLASRSHALSPPRARQGTSLGRSTAATPQRICNPARTHVTCSAPAAPDVVHTQTLTPGALLQTSSSRSSHPKRVGTSAKENLLSPQSPDVPHHPSAGNHSTLPVQKITLQHRPSDCHPSQHRHPSLAKTPTSSPTATKRLNGFIRVSGMFCPGVCLGMTVPPRTCTGMLSSAADPQIQHTNTADSQR